MKNVNQDINIFENENKNILNPQAKNSNQTENIKKISINDEDQINDNILKEKEIIKAKENGFILIGKTGAGKTSLLNVIYGKDIGKVGHTSLAETKTSNYYCIKERINGKIEYFCIIDTPGLYDTNGKEADREQKQGIMELISKENIKIKGLLFLSNFQSERFDASEQSTLLEYNKIFPLKNFWKRIIFVYTHYYGDPDGYTKEEIKVNNNRYKAEIFKNLMIKIKNVSEPIQFKDLNCKYVNIFSRYLNEKKIKNNLEVRKELISEIIKYSKLDSMFTKLQIFNFENYEIEESDKYFYNCDLYIYLDPNDKIIKQKFNILKRIPKNSSGLIKQEQKISLNIENCEMDDEGNLIKKTTKKEGIEEILKNYQGEIGGGLTILSLVGVVCSAFFLPVLSLPFLSVAGGGAFLWYKNKKDKEEDKRKVAQIMLEQNLYELIKEELSKFKE